MLLTIDVGNTNITFGLYQGETLGPRWRVATDHQRMPDEYGILMVNLFRHAGLGPEAVHGIALASVVPPLTGVVLTDVPETTVPSASTARAVALIAGCAVGTRSIEKK